MSTLQKARQKQKQAESVLKKLERPFALKMHRATNKFYQAAYHDHVKGYGTGFTNLYQSYKHQVYAILGQYAKYAVDKFVGMELIHHKSGSLILETKTKRQSYVESIYQNYMHLYGAQQVRYITETSRNDLQDAFSDVDMSQGDLQTALEESLGASAFRSALIATTETHNAGSYAAFESVKNLSNESGKVFKKAWVATEDERTRPDHAIMDPEEFIGMDEMFDIGGEQALRPGDANLSPAQSCNCRCQNVYEESDYIG